MQGRKISAPSAKHRLRKRRKELLVYATEGRGFSLLGAAVVAWRSKHKVVRHIFPAAA